jgi:hypothetical protein
VRSRTVAWDLWNDPNRIQTKANLLLAELSHRLSRLSFPRFDHQAVASHRARIPMLVSLLVNQVSIDLALAILGIPSLLPIHTAARAYTRLSMQ